MENFHNEKAAFLEKKLEESNKEKNDMAYKLKMNDDFWSTKCEKLEKELMKLTIDSKENNINFNKKMKELQKISTEFKNSITENSGFYRIKNA